VSDVHMMMMMKMIKLLYASCILATKYSHTPPLLPPLRAPSPALVFPHHAVFNARLEFVKRGLVRGAVCKGRGLDDRQCFSGFVITIITCTGNSSASRKTSRVALPVFGRRAVRIATRADCEKRVVGCVVIFRRTPSSPIPTRRPRAPNVTFPNLGRPLYRTETVVPELVSYQPKPVVRVGFVVVELFC
jgi:hypothetical protein